MTGSLQIKNGRYYAVLNCKGQDGKRKQKWIASGLTVKNNKRKAEEFLQRELRRNALEEERRQGNDGNVPFCDFLKEWLETVQRSLSETTVPAYRSIIFSSILPYFLPLHLDLNEVQPYHIQRFYRYEMEEKNCSANTVLHHHSVLKSAFTFALKLKLISENPMEGVMRPRKERFTGNFYTADQLNRLLSTAAGTVLEAPVWLAGCYGLRRSEALGVRWSGIDFERGTLSVSGTVVEVSKREGGNLLVRDAMKTDSSYRTFPLTPKIKQFLYRLQEQQQKNREVFGSAYHSEYEDFVCVTKEGKLIHPNYVTKQFPNLLKKAGLPPVRFHDLRHSCATLLLDTGGSLKEVQLWLGHSSFQTTADIYAHIEYKNKLKLAANLEAALEEQGNGRAGSSMEGTPLPRVYT